MNNTENMAQYTTAKPHVNDYQMAKRLIVQNLTEFAFFEGINEINEKY